MGDVTEGSPDDGSADPGGPHEVTREPEQSDEDAELQEENAETSLDQPSS